MELPDRSDKLPLPLPEVMAVGAGEYARQKAIRAANEMARRQIEALNLYQPTPVQEQYHSCNAMECLFQAGNQLGKSLAGFIEDARAVLGRDPYNKYPKRDGVLGILGYKESHISLNVYRYLFRAGSFDIIRDYDTGLWRTYHPWVPDDLERVKEKKPAPPLIPKRYVQKIYWKSQAGNIFKRVDLTTGWQIHAFSSTAKPDQGFQLDLAHIDEDIINEDWYSELMARLSMRKGKMRWTALPHNENDALNRVAERAEQELAEEQRGGPKSSTLVVRATIFDNPYMTEEVRQENIKRWKAISEEEYRKRALGELVTDSVRMYPTFGKEVHAVQRYKDSHAHLFGEYLKTREIPDSWCLRLYVDPGFDTAAGLIIATLPAGFDLHIAVKEIYLHQATPSMFVESLRDTLKGRWLQDAVMDAHGGALTSLTSGERPQEIYEQQMAKHNIISVDRKHRFRAGCDSIAYREQVMRERLAIQINGLPQFLFDEEMCPNLMMEMIRFRKLKISGEVIDKGNRRKRTHLVECFEYASADKLHYEKPPTRRVTLTPGEMRAIRFRKKKAARNKSKGPQAALTGGFVL